MERAGGVGGRDECVELLFFFVVVMSLRFLSLRPDVGSLSFDVQSSETVLTLIYLAPFIYLICNVDTKETQRLQLKPSYKPNLVRSPTTVHH